MANDRKVTGKKYRILTNAANRAWDVISFWTSARDVEMDDGRTLQTTVDSIVEEIEENNEEINEKVPFKLGVENGEYGYYKVGADTLTPFKTGGYLVYVGSHKDSIDVKSICEQYSLDYTTLHASDFVFVLTKVSINASSVDLYHGQSWVGYQNDLVSYTKDKTYVPTITYDEQSGIVKCNQSNLSRIGGTKTYKQTASNGLTYDEATTSLATGSVTGDIYLRVNVGNPE